MLELIGWNVGMSTLAAFFLIVGAVAIGVIFQLIGEVRVGWEWFATAAAALVGGYVGSEALGTVSTFGPAFEGLYVVTAIVGGVIIGAAVDAILRYSTHGSYMHEPRPI
jgi:uncharacterized membrane protein YeaQ/YmgE (transglycosylase-associated protein family)